MNTERKILIVSAATCLLAACASLIIAAVIASGPTPARAIVAMTAFAVTWWLGCSITEVLKKNPKE